MKQIWTDIIFCAILIFLAIILRNTVNTYKNQCIQCVDEVTRLRMDNAFQEMYINVQKEAAKEDSLKLEVSRDQVAELWGKLERCQKDKK